MNSLNIHLKLSHPKKLVTKTDLKAFWRYDKMLFNMRTLNYFAYILLMATNLRFSVSVVQFYGKFGPGYSFDLAFKDLETNKVYEGLFWYPEDENVEPAMVLEADALEEAYKDNFKMHPHFKDYLEIVVKAMPERSTIQAEVDKNKGGSSEVQ
jgi:hypothetical protein